MERRSYLAVWVAAIALLAYATPARADFAQVVTTSTGISAPTASTTHTITNPSGVVAGDLIISCVMMGNASGVSWGNDGFAILGPWDSQASHILTCGSKLSDGTEGATTTMTSVGSATSKFASYRITGQNADGAIATGNPMAKGSSTFPDPPSVTPSWGSADNLVIAVAGLANAVHIIGFPYPDNNIAAGDATTTDNIGMCSDELTASSHNPGVFTAAASGSWLAQTIVVRSAPAAPAATGCSPSRGTLMGVSCTP